MNNILCIIYSEIKVDLLCIYDYIRLIRRIFFYNKL